MQVLDSDFRDIRHLFDFKRSKLSSKKHLYTAGIENLEAIDLKTDYSNIIGAYKLVISLHCKQIFPSDLVNNILCVNIHPGYNPYNRGWYPQVFAVIEKTILGATIHVIDEKIDHGPIIDRQQVKIEKWYTSKEAYEKVLDVEIDLFKRNIRNIISGEFKTITPEIEGEFHTKQDFDELCRLDLSEKMTMGDAIDKLRALSHGAYENAWFTDEDGNKIYVGINLRKQ